MNSVSVVIPTIGRHSLVAAVESVISQTLEPKEILVIVSGKDLNLPVLEFIRYLPSVRIISNPSLSAASGRNIGIKESVGSFIAFLDDDDLWLPHKLEKQLEFADFDIISSKALYSGWQSGERPKRIFSKNVLESFYPNKIPSRRAVVLPTPTLIIRSKNARECLFDESLSEREDIWFLHNLEISGASFYQVNEVLVEVRTRKPLSDRSISVDEDLRWAKRLDNHKRGLGGNFLLSVAIRNRLLSGDFFGTVKLILWLVRVVR
jgi:glycosyltransferase involved in cell wall biosynthesis